jgi:hypothetical protein
MPGFTFKQLFDTVVLRFNYCLSHPEGRLPLQNLTEIST